MTTPDLETLWQENYRNALKNHDFVAAKRLEDHIFGKYALELLDKLHRQFHNLPQESIEDVWISTLHKFYDQVKKEKIKENVKGWLWKVAYNGCIDETKKVKKWEKKSAQEGENQAFERLDYEAETDKIIFFILSIYFLTEYQRKAFVLFHFHKLSYKEIEQQISGEFSVKKAIEGAKEQSKKLAKNALDLEKKRLLTEIESEKLLLNLTETCEYEFEHLLLNPMLCFLTETEYFYTISHFLKRKSWLEIYRETQKNLDPIRLFDKLKGMMGTYTELILLIR